MIQRYKILKTITIIDVVVVVFFLGIAKLYEITESGIYQAKVLGAIYEIVWLPLIVTLFALPFIWIFLTVKKKISFSAMIFPLIILIGLICYMLIWF
ncbi:hypothetical protein [Myroides indicus]|uniref:Uncharacterized protein n=1 Tax=Myroides indicus TaxID=1323422 RepID=A0A4R7ENE8_9FLAO|nr:hypothetical protein [Myroides indicus]TDS52725.1 hypothetical protein C8P70_13024 [Myroides indicus]